MGVTVNTTRKAVEIAWDTEGYAEEPPEVNVPEFPTHPIVGDPSGPRPDHELPGDQPSVEHPIFLPPYIDNSLPGDQPGIWGPTDPRPDTGPVEPPEEGTEEPPEGAFPGDPGYRPPDGAAVPTPQYDTALAVQVFAQGQEGDWSNTAVMPNDGLAVLTFPEDFVGESYVEVRAFATGLLVDSGTISVE